LPTIQRNAIASWTRLDPRPEIFLFGEEEGTRELAGEIGDPPFSGCGPQ